ncbi:hypothetical protein [Paraburkholderia hayleyella]|uniref:hypothetical protein n=1 Tax=Paraburkholderia hayleyella TaxID=2152889 RepID=UPI00157FE8FA|nr:hypothetical protein [Paraburkholderia hayleyella]
MKAAAVPQWNPSGPGISRLQLGLPLELWSDRRRWMVGLLLAATVFILGVQGWYAADLGHLMYSRTLFEDVQQRLLAARKTVQGLPGLRHQVASARQSVTRVNPYWSTADDVRIVSQLAAQSGIELLTLEHGVASGAGGGVAQPVHIVARTDFAGLLGFLGGFASLPVLVVPGDLTIKRDRQYLTLSATLQVYRALSPAAPAVAAVADTDIDADADADADADEGEVLLLDPFAAGLATAEGNPSLTVSASLKLVGLLRQGSRSLALVETPDGVMTVAPGQHLGVERVSRITARGITLARLGNQGDGQDEERFLAFLEKTP